MEFFFFFLIPNTYQNNAVLVRGENPIFRQNGAVLVFDLISFFFSPRGYFGNLQSTKRRSFDFFYPLSRQQLMEGAKIQLSNSLVGHFITFETLGG
jgi:hypothetical protein